MHRIVCHVSLREHAVLPATYESDGYLATRMKTALLAYLVLWFIEREFSRSKTDRIVKVKQRNEMCDQQTASVSQIHHLVLQEIPD
jgi:hypothetical protein